MSLQKAWSMDLQSFVFSPNKQDLVKINCMGLIVQRFTSNKERLFYNYEVKRAGLCGGRQQLHY